MLTIRDHLVREASALYGFVDSIALQCIRIPQSVAFPESSTRFFNHVHNLASATKSHLAAFPKEDVENSTDEELNAIRGELSIIRKVWRSLHQFIKPATDADTLNQPTALVAAMLNRARNLPGLEHADFAIFHTDSFDYLQVNPTSIRDIAQRLAFIVDAEEFPAGLGLIGIPSTQGSSLFLNCLVAHEIGEYAYAERSLNNQLQPEVEVAFQHVYGNEYDQYPKTKKSSFIDTVLKWGKELFCDLFAVYLIGPCYTCAYVELFDLQSMISRDGSITTTTASSMIRFYPQHPSHPFRVKYQADLLKRLDWWPHLRDIDSRSIRVLEALMGVSDSDFVDAADAEGRNLILAFFKIIPEISRQLGNIIGSLETGVHEFGQLRKHVNCYLQEGIVPSTITIENGGQSEHVIPGSITLLNCFTCFYLDKLDRLMSGIEGQDPSSAEQRVYWMRKLESWTSKALVDITLFNRS